MNKAEVLINRLADHDDFVENILELSSKVIFFMTVGTGVISTTVGEDREKMTELLSTILAVIYTFAQEVIEENHPDIEIEEKLASLLENDAFRTVSMLLLTIGFGLGGSHAMETFEVTPSKN